MKSRYKIDIDQNLILKDHFGDVTIDDEFDILNAIFDDPNHHPGMNAVCDFTEATMNWNLGDIDKFRLYAAKNKKKAGKSRWAIIFPKGKNTIAIRLLIVLNNSLDSTLMGRLFNNRKEALAWVTNIPKPVS